MDVMRPAIISKIMMNPHDIDKKDISNVYFNIVLGITNSGDEEREINCALHEDCEVGWMAMSL